MAADPPITHRVHELIQTLRSEFKQERQEVKRDLIDLGMPAVESLLHVVEDADAGVRFHAVNALSEFEDRLGPFRCIPLRAPALYFPGFGARKHPVLFRSIPRRGGQRRGHTVLNLVVVQ